MPELYDGVELHERHQGEQPLPDGVVFRVNNVEDGLTKLAETTNGEEPENPAQREERLYKQKMAALEAEQKEEDQHHRYYYLTHLRKVYANRLATVEAALEGLEGSA